MWYDRTTNCYYWTIGACPSESISDIEWYDESPELWLESYNLPDDDCSDICQDLITAATRYLHAHYDDDRYNNDHYHYDDDDDCCEGDNELHRTCGENGRDFVIEKYHLVRDIGALEFLQSDG